MKTRNTKKKTDIPLKTDRLANRKKDPNKENKAHSKRTINQVNRHLTKKEEEPHTLQSLVIHALIRKDLEGIKFLGLLEKLKTETKKSALVRDVKIDKVAEAVGKRLQVEMGGKVTEERLQVVEKEKQHLNELYIVKNLEFQKKEEESIEIKRKDEEITHTRLTIEGELKKLSQDIESVNQQFEMIDAQRKECKDKVDTHNSHRIEMLTSTLVMKPLIKRIAVIRKDKENNDVRIEKNRKDLYLSSSIGVGYSFNYIISVIDNLIATKNTLSNENDFLHNEIATMLYGYLTHEIEYLLVLYLTSFPDVSSFDNVSHIVEQLNQRDFFDTKYTGFSDNMCSSVNSLKEIANRKDIDNISVDIYKGKVPKITMIVSNYQNKDIKQLLTQLNEMNTKRKKTKTKSSFCIPSMSILIQHLNSLNVISPFPTLIIHDVFASNLNNDTLSI